MGMRPFISPPRSMRSPLSWMPETLYCSPSLTLRGDIDALLVRGHGDLGGLLGEADIAAVHVVGAQHFDVTGQLLLLVALIAGEVPPGHVVLRESWASSFSSGKTLLPTMLICWILAASPSTKVNLRSTWLRGSGVTMALTLAEYLPPRRSRNLPALSRGSQHGAIQRITHADPGGFQALGQLLFLDILVAGELDAGDGRALLDHHLQHLTVAIDLDVLEVAGGIELLMAFARDTESTESPTRTGRFNRAAPRVTRCRPST